MAYPRGHEAGAVRSFAGDVFVANCAPDDLPTASKLAANDLGGAEERAGLALGPAADELRHLS